MKIKVAFYKGKGDFVNAIVRWWTNSVYSHAELVLADNVTWIGISPFVKSKIDKKIKLQANPNDWEFITLEITEQQYDVIMQFFADTEGHGYDWVGMLLSQFLPCKIKHRKRWYCSEWIAYALRIACIFDWRTLRLYERKDLSPQVLYNLLEELKNAKGKKI